MVDNQEETMAYETDIKKAWIIIALSDKTEFEIVYNFLFNFDKENKRVKELYNKEAFVFQQESSLVNIRDTYLKKYDLLQPENILVQRYAKFLYDNYQDNFPKNKEFILMLQNNHQLQVEDLSDFDYEEFAARKENFLNPKVNEPVGTKKAFEYDEGQDLVPDLMAQVQDINNQITH